MVLEKNALFLAQLHFMVFILWKFCHNLFIGEGEVVETRFSYVQSRTSICPHILYPRA